MLRACRCSVGVGGRRVAGEHQPVAEGRVRCLHRDQALQLQACGQVLLRQGSATQQERFQLRWTDGYIYNTMLYNGLCGT